MTAAVRAAAILCLSVALARCTHETPAATLDARVRVTDEVLLSAPPRLGVNLGANAYYGDQQMVAAPFAHGGFPMGRQATLITVEGGGANTARDARFNPADPDRHHVVSFAGGRYAIMTGPRAGEHGAITAHPAGTAEFTLEHSGPPLADGELILAHGPWAARVLPPNPQGEPGAGIGDFRAALDDGVLLDYVPTGDDPRDQCLRLAFPGGARTASGVRHYLKAVPGAEYTLRFRARTELPGATVGVEFRNFGIPEGLPGNRVALGGDPPSGALDGAWREFTFTGRVPNDLRVDEGLSVIAVLITAPAGSAPGAAYLDDIALEDGALATPSGFSRPLVERLKEARCGVLRFYGIAELSTLVDGITARSAADAPWTFLSLASRGRAGLVHAVVDQWMLLAEEVGAEPWITVGAPNLPEDWHNLISYLAAPADFDDASRRRAAHGHPEPWTARFGTIHLEIGNEWWNGIFSPYHITQPAKYGEFCATIARAARAHPHFDAGKIRIVAGGWAINANNWNGAVDAAAEGVDAVSIAPYLLHALDRHDTPEARYGPLFADVEAYARDGGRRTREALSANGKGTRLAVYELNTHLVSGAAPAEAASAVCTSVAAGVAVLDQALSVMAGLQASPVNYFTALQRGFNSGGTRLGLWGVLRREADGTLRPRPVWHGLRLANRHLIDGDLVRAEVIDGPSWDQPENGSVPATRGVPYLAAYAFRREGGYNVLLVNRHRATPIRAAIALPGGAAAAGPIRTATLTGARIGDHNEDSERVTLREGTLAANADSVEVPPFSAVVCQIDMAR